MPGPIPSLASAALRSRAAQPSPIVAALARKASTSSSSAIPVPSRVTTLPSRLRVVTEPSPGHFHAVGVYVDAGSRYETPRTSGVSHLLDRLAFKSTDKFSDDEMTRLIDQLGSQVACTSSRETIMYQTTVFPSALPLALSLLSSTIQHPNILPSELAAQKDAAAYEIREIWAKPELILPEILHTAAFKDNTLGMPLLCPEQQLDALTESDIRRFMRDWYRPERMVVAGVGMQHDELVELADQHFGSMATPDSVAPIPGNSVRASTPGTQPAGSKGFATISNVEGAVEERQRLASARAVYTGGQHLIDKPDEQFVHLMIGFEGLGVHDPDIYALATLQTLLGGGGSFSAGGPGKGMYTRLYTNVLNRYYAVDFCAGFHHCYADSGLFGISASVYPEHAGAIANIVCHQLDTLTRPMVGGITEREMRRAKNMLKSQLVMALESRLVAVEDLGRQTQIHGNKVPVEEMCAKIDALTLTDLHRTATRVLRPSSTTTPLNYGLGSGLPTIVGLGQVERLGDVQQVVRDWALGRQ
ncbi:Mitochondrial-processing peptidase subunit alpha [Cryptotrichosporon argae]